jgi:ABC-type branched-subunit amino acid transport system substrate-binding protein
VTRESVLAEVAKTDIAQTILGTPMKFDANGDVEGAQFYIFEVKDGKFSLIVE